MIKNNWKYSKLADVCEINPGKKELKELDGEMEVSFVPMADVSEDGTMHPEQKRKLKDVLKGYTYFKESDVLLAKITPCFENGKRAIAKDLMNNIGFGSTEFHVLRSQGKATPRWIYYAISRDDFRNIAKSQMTGTAGQKRVPTRILEEFEIPVPDTNIQEDISDNIETQFTRLDAAIKSLKTIKTKLETYRQSVLKAAFEGRLASVGKLKENDFNEVCDTITDGTHLTPPLVSTGIPMLDVKDLDDSFNIWIVNPKKFISLATDKELAKRCKPKEDDILISSRGTIGRVGIVKEGQNFNIMGNMILIRVNRSVLNVKYTAYVLKFLKYEFEKIARGVAQKGLYLRNVRAFRLKYPQKLAEQDNVVAEIESRLSVIDKLEQTITTALLKAERLRKSILKAAFEGSLRR